MITEPNALTASINHERMPVQLANPEHCETWLKGTPREAFTLARPFSADAMRIVQVGCGEERVAQIIGRVEPISSTKP